MWDQKLTRFAQTERVELKCEMEHDMAENPRDADVEKGFWQVGQFQLAGQQDRS